MKKRKIETKRWLPLGVHTVTVTPVTRPGAANCQMMPRNGYSFHYSLYASSASWHGYVHICL